MLAAFVYEWSLIQQVEIIIPASFGIFFLSALFDRGDTPGRAQLFKNLNTPVDIKTELKDSPDFTVPVFRFLSRTILGIGILSLSLLLTAPPNQKFTVLCFALLTLGVGLSLGFIRGDRTQLQAEHNLATASHKS